MCVLGWVYHDLSLFLSSQGPRWDSCWFLFQKKSRFVSTGVTKIWDQYLHDCGTKIYPMLELSQLHSRKTDSKIEGFKESQWIWRLFALTVKNQPGKSLHLPNHYIQEAIRRGCHVFSSPATMVPLKRLVAKLGGSFWSSPLMAPTL